MGEVLYYYPSAPPSCASDAPPMGWTSPQQHLDRQQTPTILQPSNDSEVALFTFSPVESIQTVTMSNLEAVSAFVEGAPPGEVRAPLKPRSERNRLTLSSSTTLLPVNLPSAFRYAKANNRIDEYLVRYQAAHPIRTPTGRAARAGFREVQ